METNHCAHRAERHKNVKLGGHRSSTPDPTRIVDIAFFVFGGGPSAFYLDRIELH